MTVLNTASTLVPILLGLLIPFLTSWISNHLPVWVETIANFALSALAGTLPTIAFDGEAAHLGTYLLAIFVAWVATMRSSYTEIPKMITNKAVGGRHEKQDQV